MLIAQNIQIQNPTIWESLQQPVHGTRNQSSSLRLLSALDEGWQIQEVASYLAHGYNAESIGYLLTLYHPMRNQTREIDVPQSRDIDEILKLDGSLIISD